MGSDEWNKGYNSYGPHSTQDARDGAWYRERQEAAGRAERESARAREREEDLNRQLIAQSARPVTWHGGNSATTDSTPATPATFVGTLQGCALAGVMLAVAYAWLGLGRTDVAALLTWGLQGAVAGTVAGVALYLLIIALRIAVAVLAFVLKLALWAALILGALWLLGAMAGGGA